MPTVKQALTDQEGNNNTTSTNVANATNTNNNKRIKNVSLATNNIADTKNVIQKVNSDVASSTNKRQRPSDEEDDSSSLDDSSSKEISVIDILLPYEGPELAEETLRVLASKQGWRFGIGQRNIATIQRALFDYYNKVDNGVDKLQEDIAAINNGEYSSDSDSDDDDDELEEINKKSLVAAEEDDGDFSFDNDDGDESTNGATDGLDTASADVPLHDNATQSFTTTLKLDISCTGCGVKDDDGNGNGVKDNESNGVVEDNRIEPSPTNVEADLSGYNHDNTPSSLCYETLSPKKVNTKEIVGNNNTPTTAMSTPQTIQTSPSSAFTANLGKESEIYKDQAPSNHGHGMLLQQFQQQQHQLSFPQHQYYDRATLESMSTEELSLLYYQHQQRQQQRQQQQMRQFYDSMSDEELCFRYYQHQQRQHQQRQQQQKQYLELLALQQQQRQQTLFGNPWSSQDVSLTYYPLHLVQGNPQQCNIYPPAPLQNGYPPANSLPQMQIAQSYQPPTVGDAAASSKYIPSPQPLKKCGNAGIKSTSTAADSNNVTAFSSQVVPQCCEETEPEEEINSEGEVVKQQCQGGCGRMLGKNHFTKNQWKRQRKCMKCLLPQYTRLLGSIEKATEYIAQETSVPQTSEVENGNKRRRRKKKRSIMVVMKRQEEEKKKKQSNKRRCRPSPFTIPSPPVLEGEFKAWLKENPNKEKEWEASKRVEKAQYEALHAATNNLKPSRKLIRLIDEEWVRQDPRGFRRYMFHLRYDLGLGLEGDQVYLPLMCFDLHHNSAAAVKKKQEDKVKLNGRCQPKELTYEELEERSHLLTLLPKSDHALETHAVPKLLDPKRAHLSQNKKYAAVAAFETSILGVKCTMSGEVLPDHIFDGHHRTEKCDLQEGGVVYPTAKVCTRDGLYHTCTKDYITWRNRLFNEVLKKTRLKKEWHKVLHWVLRNLDWFASQGITINYPYKVVGAVLVQTKG